MERKGFAPIIFILGILVVSGLMIGGYVYIKYQKPELLGNYGQTAKIIQKNSITSGSTQQVSNKINTDKTGYKVAYKNISLLLPVAKIDSQQELSGNLVIKYNQEKMVMIVSSTPDSLLKVSDLSLDNSDFVTKYKNSAYAEVALQKQAIEKFSGNYDQNINRDFSTQDKLKIIKNLYLNFKGHIYSTVIQNNQTIILDKSTPISSIELEDKAGNHYKILVGDSEDTLNYLISTLQVN